MRDQKGSRAKIDLGKDRLDQVGAYDRLQSLLDMYWSSKGNANEVPILTSVTIHYRLESSRRRRRIKNG